MKFILMALLCCLTLLQHDPIQRARQRVESIKTDTLAWDTETCNFIGTFDTSKFSKKQLRDTYRLWFTYNALQISANTLVFVPDEYDSYDSNRQLRQLEGEYAERKRDYAQMDLAPGKIWQELLKNRIKDLDETYELAKIDLIAHTQPKILLNNRFTKFCPEYAEALASGDTTKMMATWGKLMKEPAMGGYNEESFLRYKNNLGPERTLAYAKTYLLTFGWHNCANRQINHDMPNVNYREEFEKLFLAIDKDCEEP